MPNPRRSNLRIQPVDPLVSSEKGKGEIGWTDLFLGGIGIVESNQEFPLVQFGKELIENRSLFSP